MRQYPASAKESSDYLILQQRLRDLQILKATVTGNFRVLVPATIPDEPISPKPRAQMRSSVSAVGLLLGIGARLPARAGRHAGAPSGRRRRDAASAHPRAHPASVEGAAEVALPGHPRASRRSGLRGVPRLAQQPRVHGRRPQGQDPHGHEQHAGRGQERAGGQSGGHPGAGGQEGHRGRRRPAPTAAAQAVRSLQRCRRQHRRRPAIPRSSGRCSPSSSCRRLETRPSPTSTAWAAGRQSVTRLWVLTSGPIPPNPGEIVASQRFAQILARLRAEADFVLVDSPAMLAVGDTAALATEVDGLIFLVDMEKARRQVLQAAADQLYRLPCAMMGVAVRSVLRRLSPRVLLQPLSVLGGRLSRAASAAGKRAPCRCGRGPA